MTCWLEKIRELDIILTERYGMLLSGSPKLTDCILAFALKHPFDPDANKGLNIIHAYSQTKITRSGKRF